VAYPQHDEGILALVIALVLGKPDAMACCQAAHCAGPLTALSSSSSAWSISSLCWSAAPLSLAMRSPLPS
jgi:hypothetical protein